MRIQPPLRLVCRPASVKGRSPADPQVTDRARNRRKRLAELARAVGLEPVARPGTRLEHVSHVRAKADNPDRDIALFHFTARDCETVFDDLRQGQWRGFGPAPLIKRFDAIGSIGDVTGRGFSVGQKYEMAAGTLAVDIRILFGKDAGR